MVVVIFKLVLVVMVKVFNQCVVGSGFFLEGVGKVVGWVKYLDRDVIVFFFWVIDFWGIQVVWVVCVIKNQVIGFFWCKVQIMFDNLLVKIN